MRDPIAVQEAPTDLVYSAVLQGDGTDTGYLDVSAYDTLMIHAQSAGSAGTVNDAFLWQFFNKHPNPNPAVYYALDADFHTINNVNFAAAASAGGLRLKVTGQYFRVTCYSNNINGKIGLRVYGTKRGTETRDAVSRFLSQPIQYVLAGNAGQWVPNVPNSMSVQPVLDSAFWATQQNYYPTFSGPCTMTLWAEGTINGALAFMPALASVTNPTGMKRYQVIADTSECHAVPGITPARRAVVKNIYVPALAIGALGLVAFFPDSAGAAGDSVQVEFSACGEYAG